jgi:hypothetical protein
MVALRNRCSLPLLLIGVAMYPIASFEQASVPPNKTGRIINLPDAKQHFVETGYEFVRSTPEQFTGCGRRAVVEDA